MEEEQDYIWVYNRYTPGNEGPNLTFNYDLEVTRVCVNSIFADGRTYKPTRVEIDDDPIGHQTVYVVVLFTTQKVSSETYLNYPTFCYAFLKKEDAEKFREQHEQRGDYDSYIVDGKGKHVFDRYEIHNYVLTRDSLYDSK